MRISSLCVLLLFCLIVLFIDLSFCGVQHRKRHLPSHFFDDFHIEAELPKLSRQKRNPKICGWKFTKRIMELCFKSAGPNKEPIPDSKKRRKREFDDSKPAQICCKIGCSDEKIKELVCPV